MKLKGIILLVVLLIGAGLIFFITRQEQPPKSVQSEAPRFSVAGAGGKIISSGDLKGKVTFVHFWAPW